MIVDIFPILVSSCSKHAIYMITTEVEGGNSGGSYLTFYSPGGLIFGIVNIVGNFGTVFCDQAYWQSSVAAKPLQVMI